MREHFDPLPAGSFRLSRRYVGRLQRAARRGTGVDLISAAGAVDDNDLLGAGLVPDPEFWIWARITDDGSSGGSSGGSYYQYCDFPGCSWVEVIPQRCGGWRDATVADGGLRGDNGSGGGLAFQPAFEINGLDVAVGTIVQLFRGYQHGGREQLRPGQEWVFQVGSGGANSAVRILRVVGPPVPFNGWEYYPAVIQQDMDPGSFPPFLDEMTDLTITTGDDPTAHPINAWWASPYTYPDVVGIDGNSYRTSLYQNIPDFDPTGVGYALPLYADTQYSALRAVACSGDPPGIVGDLGP